MIDPVTFEHDGVTYTVAPLTVFQDSMIGFVGLDFKRLVMSDMGLNPENDNLPNLLNMLGWYFVEWVTMTSFSERVPYDVNLLLSDNKAILKAWHAFREAITSDDELANKWLQAVRDVKPKPDAIPEDEKKDASSD